MTKEELAKKKGMKIKETSQTAAESLVLTKPSAKTEEKEVKKEQKVSEKKPAVKEAKKEQPTIEVESKAIAPAQESVETRPAGKAISITCFSVSSLRTPWHFMSLISL